VEGLHIHAYVRYVSRVTWSPRAWDITYNGVLYHGNYQCAKSAEAVYKYCKKDGDFIANISPKNALAKRASRNQELLSEKPQQLIASGSIGLLQLPNLLKAKAAYQLLQPALQSDNVRGIWVHGASGNGKSHFVRARHPADELFLKSQNKWWDGYQGESFVLLDDFDGQGTCLSHYLKIWADKWACTGEVKGATVSLRHTTFYVTSQYTIEQLWPGDEHAELREALTRRFTLIEIPRHTPLEPEDIEEDQRHN